MPRTITSQSVEVRRSKGTFVALFLRFELEKKRWTKDGEFPKQNGTKETIIIPLNVVMQLLFN